MRDMTLTQLWEDVFSSQAWGKYPAEGLIRFIARNFYKRDRKEVCILEVGCGPGPNLWYFSREGFKTYGIDVSSVAIEQARRRLMAEGLTADLTVGNIEQLPYPDGQFDCVVDNECLYCNSKEVTFRIMKEISRVMKKGGLFFSRTFTDESYLGRSQKKVGDLEYEDVSDGPFAGKGFVRVINLNGIKKLYGSVFKIVSIDKQEYTYNDRAAFVSEWQIICEKGLGDEK